MPKIELIQGDCLEVMDELIEKGVVVDAIITDPPYGTTACKWDSVIPFDKMWERLKKLIKPNGAIVLFGSEPFSSLLRVSNLKNFKYDWIYRKPQGVNPLLSKKQPLNDIENICVFYKKQPTYNPQMTKGRMRNKKIAPTKDFEVYGQITPIDNFNDDYYPSSILEFTNANQKAKSHTTQKSLELMEYLVRTYTNEGDMVLDNTMGSGTTNLACLKLNRKSIGIEKEKKYYDVAVQRLSSYCG